MNNKILPKLLTFESTFFCQSLTMNIKGNFTLSTFEGKIKFNQNCFY